jgi:hypothetical protein
MSDRRGVAFQRALDEAVRQDRGLKEDEPEPAGAPRVRASLEVGRAPGSGGYARFGLALAWADDPADWPGRNGSISIEETASESVDTPGAIAAELGLGAPLTPDELASRWRKFVWRNHPDRQPDHARGRANARVAIANELYHRARRELARRR